MNSALITNFLPSLIVFALTGLTIVAYNYPTRYFSLYKNLAFILIGIAVAGDVWNYATHQAFGEVSEFIAPEKRAIAFNVIKSFDTPWWLFAAVLAVGCYLSLLGFLPSFFGSGEKPDSEKPGSEKPSSEKPKKKTGE